MTQEPARSFPDTDKLEMIAAREGRQASTFDLASWRDVREYASALRTELPPAPDGVCAAIVAGAIAALNSYRDELRVSTPSGYSERTALDREARESASIADRIVGGEGASQ